MRVQNLDEGINVIYKPDILTHKNFKEDLTLKTNGVGRKIFRTHPDRPWGPPSLLHLHDENRVLSQG
jgi:hypothetical protein